MMDIVKIAIECGAKKCKFLGTLIPTRYELNAEQLQAFSNEIIEMCAKECSSLRSNDDYGEFLANKIRNLKG